MPPRTFQFVDVVPKRGDEPGGWQIACVKALIGQGLPDEPYVDSHVCEIQVQVPLETKAQGAISRRKAQYASAAAANDAAYAVLQESLGVSELVCRRIRREMESRLRRKISSAKVTACIPVPSGRGTVAAPPVYWPEPH